MKEIEPPLNNNVCHIVPLFWKHYVFYEQPLSLSKRLNVNRVTWSCCSTRKEKKRKKSCCSVQKASEPTNMLIEQKFFIINSFPVCEWLQCRQAHKSFHLTCSYNVRKTLIFPLILFFRIEISLNFLFPSQILTRMHTQSTNMTVFLNNT